VNLFPLEEGALEHIERIALGSRSSDVRLSSLRLVVAFKAACGADQAVRGRGIQHARKSGSSRRKVRWRSLKPRRFHPCARAEPPPTLGWFCNPGRRGGVVMFLFGRRSRTLVLALGLVLVGLAIPVAGMAGGPPSIAWSPTTSPGTYDYGALTLGASASQTFTLTNSGGSGTGTLKVMLSGSTAFSVTSDNCTAIALGPVKSCAVTVRYAPPAAGSNTATLFASAKKPAASASLTLTGTGAPARHVYWANDFAGTIGRASVDGSNPNQSFITGANNPVGVAVDGNYVYWTDYAAGTIGRANLDGTSVNQTFITGASNPRGVAVDGSHIYWTNQFPHTIGRANLDGSGVDQAFITTAGEPYGMTVDGSYVYWTSLYGVNTSDDDTISRASLDGSNVNESFITGASAPTGLAVDGTYVYWVNQLTHSIARANLDGTNPNQSFITGLIGGVGLAVDASYIYWGNFGADTVGRANLDGSGVNQAFITGAVAPAGVAVD